jgi:deoxyribonuclease-4
LSDLVAQAKAHNISVFQFFLISQATNKYLTFDAADKTAFLNARRDLNATIFIHSAYWINPSTSDKRILSISRSLLFKEAAIAQMLEIPYLVLHAGSARGHQRTADDPLCKQGGIAALTTLLNHVLKRHPDVTILIENGAHGSFSIGSDLEDFITIRNYLDYPERIGFCIDFAHAYSYGYDLVPTDTFVAILNRCMGLEQIKLIHFNDTVDTHGSMQDRHAFPGQGNIGKTVLQELLNHPQLTTIPKIIEGPDGDAVHNETALKTVNSWLLHQ